jgi:N-acyl-D-aspartate/D-glutamate deacylase
MLRSALMALVLALFQQPASYDIVLNGGRVMDPETGLDAVRSVGISGGRIAAVSEQPLRGATVLDAAGQVVTAGFIDLHSHGQDPENYRLKALDGVTTALELEIGVEDVGKFLQERRGRSAVNYGATASHPFARVLAFGFQPKAGAIVPASGPATETPANAEQLAKLSALVRKGLDDGGLGIGMGIAYTPAATRSEIIETFRLAAERRLPVFTHVRSTGRTEPGSSVEAMSEVIAAAAITGASLHIVHMNSSGARDAPECLRMVEGARARGLDVTTEAYPYIAGMTAVNSAIFNPGWREKLGVDYRDLQLVETGERLTRESFDRLHASPEPKLVVIFSNTEEMVQTVIRHPLVMIASDGHIEKGKGHPRSSGTYALILGRYVRERQQLTLMDALRKMSLMPAQRLERATAAARRKGRLQVGADADVVVFDARTVVDRSTYSSPAEPSAGFRHVLVSGTPVVRDGKFVDGVFPGRPVVSDQSLATSVSR